MNIDEFKSIGTHWIFLYVKGNNIIYFDSFGVEHIPKQIKKITGNRNIIKDIYRIEACGSIMWGYFCIGFLHFMIKGESLLDYTNLFIFS